MVRKINLLQISNIAALFARTRCVLCISGEGFYILVLATDQTCSIAWLLLEMCISSFAYTLFAKVSPLSIAKSNKKTSHLECF